MPAHHLAGQSGGAVGARGRVTSTQGAARRVKTGKEGRGDRRGGGWYNDFAAAAHGHDLAGLQRGLEVVERLDQQRRLRAGAAGLLAAGIVAEREQEEPPVAGNEIEALAGEHAVGLEVVEVDAEGGTREVDAAADLPAPQRATRARAQPTVQCRPPPRMRPTTRAHSALRRRADMRGAARRSARPPACPHLLVARVPPGISAWAASWKRGSAESL